MLEIKGKFNTATAYLDKLEDGAIEQIKELCDQEFFKNEKIKIMPDVHSGAGCVIGTTMTITDKIVPNLVGVDISCGILAVKIDHSEVDFERLDKIIRKNIPSGFEVHNRKNDEFDLKKLECFNNLRSVKHLECSLGTLGGGNHFIEVDRDSKGELWILIHSGSRNLGLQVAEHYQHKAYKTLCENARRYKTPEKEELIQQFIELKEAGKTVELKEIKEKIKLIEKQLINEVNKDLAYLEGDDFEDYLHDMRFLQKWASRNREIMVEKICVGLRCKMLDKIETVHNYIDLDNMILRKGAVSAQKDEMLLIPINMRDGTLLCKGKGNPDWNYSAPHGAGRLMSRNQAKKKLNMKEFKETMSGVYSSCIVEETLDESPMAYKPIEEILEHIEGTVEIVDTMIPIYNFKAS